MTTSDRHAGYKLIETGTLVHSDVTSADVQRPEVTDEVFVRIEIQLGEEEEDGERSEDWEWGAFGFIYVLALLSFSDARPRGVSEIAFDDNDELTVFANSSSHTNPSWETRGSTRMSSGASMDASEARATADVVSDAG